LIGQMRVGWGAGAMMGQQVLARSLSHALGWQAFASVCSEASDRGLTTG
jgi:hypothetical protein